MSLDNKNELDKLRKFLYVILTIIAFSILFFAPYFFSEDGKLPFWKDISWGIGISILAVLITQKLQDKTIQKTMIEKLSAELSINIDKMLERTIESKNSLTPRRIYFGGEEKFERDLKYYIQESTNLKFMSISANYLVAKRLQEIHINGILSIDLLLLDPTDDVNLRFRVKQMSTYEKEKDEAYLRREIIRTIAKSCILCHSDKGRNIEFRIKFHRETSLFRIEFPGDKILFISYYESQKTPHDLGTVARYERGSDVFKSISIYFRQVWDTSEHKEICIKNDTNTEEIRKLLCSRFPKCDKIIYDEFHAVF